MVNLMSYLKKNRPSISTALLKLLGVPGLVNSSDSDLGFETYLERLAFAAGVNTIIQVNDCEDNAGFSESDDGTFDLETFAATGKRVGTNSLFMTATGACDNSQYIQLLNINESAPITQKWGKKQMNWEDTRFLGFWISNDTNTGDFGTAGELQVALVSNGVVQAKVEIQAVENIVHQWIQIDMVAQGWDLSCVEALRFYSNNTNAGEVIHIDDILRYQISYNDAPLYGCAFPIKSGITVLNGANVRWTVDGLTLGDATEVVNDLGMAEVFGASLVGRAQRDRWVMIPGFQIFIARMSATVTAGEGLIFSHASQYEGVSTDEEEIAVCKALEANGNALDDIFVCRGLGNHFIG